MKPKPKEKKTKRVAHSLYIWQFLLIWITGHIIVLLAMWWILDNMGRFQSTRDNQCNSDGASDGDSGCGCTIFDH